MQTTRSTFFDLSSAQCHRRRCSAEVFARKSTVSASFVVSGRRRESQTFVLRYKTIETHYPLHYILSQWKLHEQFLRYCACWYYARLKGKSVVWLTLYSHASCGILLLDIELICMLCLRISRKYNQLINSLEMNYFVAKLGATRDKWTEYILVEHVNDGDG